MDTGEMTIMMLNLGSLFEPENECDYRRRRGGRTNTIVGSERWTNKYRGGRTNTIVGSEQNVNFTCWLGITEEPFYNE
jgi:hypothetical protein